MGVRPLFDGLRVPSIRTLHQPMMVVLWAIYDCYFGGLTMHDAELVLGLWRHLSAFSISPSTAALGNVAAAGKVYEMAWRLRLSGVSTLPRVNAIGIEAKIAPVELRMTLLPILEQLGWIRINRSPDSQIESIDEVLPATQELLAGVHQVFGIMSLTSVEFAALELLRATTRQPLEKDAALQAAAAYGDESAEEALRHLVNIRLVKEMTAADGRSAVYNPNIWTDDAAVTEAALRTEDARVRNEVGALIEEVKRSPGIPEGHVSSTDAKWIDFAVSQGLVQRSVVATEDGSEQRFLFTPHLVKDAFGAKLHDVSGNVRQLVGSMVYAATYPLYKLRSPAAFVYRLLADGEAGDASPIGTDYPMLETGGIVRVIPGSSAEKYRLSLLQADVAEGALAILRQRENGAGDANLGPAGVRGQRSYGHVERERAKLAIQLDTDDEDLKNLVAALRETTNGTSF